MENYKIKQKQRKQLIDLTVFQNNKQTQSNIINPQEILDQITQKYQQFPSIKSSIFELSSEPQSKKSQKIKLINNNPNSLTKKIEKKIEEFNGVVQENTQKQPKISFMRKNSFVMNNITNKIKNLYNCKENSIIKDNENSKFLNNSSLLNFQSHRVLETLTNRNKQNINLIQMINKQKSKEKNQEYHYSQENLRFQQGQSIRLLNLSVIHDQDKFHTKSQTLSKQKDQQVQIKFDRLKKLDKYYKSLRGLRHYEADQKIFAKK